jgi:hypothetical protein
MAAFTILPPGAPRCESLNGFESMLTSVCMKLDGLPSNADTTALDAEYDTIRTEATRRCDLFKDMLFYHYSRAYRSWEGRERDLLFQEGLDTVPCGYEDLHCYGDHIDPRE